MTEDQPRDTGVRDTAAPAAAASATAARAAAARAAADDGAAARLTRFGALPPGPDPSTWSTAQPVEHGPAEPPDRFEELRRNLLLGGA
ncbi:hypothetical protein [Quadrisphaera sp. KR29]|uniref:hypothetical protein n=1 Tax=Quadrisphaera sp. KR29 TaxID=3461391 RepID=UPI004043A305